MSRITTKVAIWRRTLIVAPAASGNPSALVAANMGILNNVKKPRPNLNPEANLLTE
jgi:hypothetical protein